jgi:hypothetical protein
MQLKNEKKWVLLGLLILGLIFSFAAAFTPIPEGGADNYAHFNIARWAFRYPQLFLDHWGKPVFTILTAPFAQLGMTGVRIFNVVAGLLTAWFCYRLAVELKLKYAWFAAIVAVFTPIYFVMMFSGMTEVLFSLVLVLSLYLFFKENYLLSAVTISFLFLVRSEGLAFIGLFFIALIVRRQYKIIPLLFSGFILFSFIGWIFYYHDFWWLFNKRPYAIGGPDIYGSGEWYTFFKKMPLYFGPVVPVFVVTGTAVIVSEWIKTKDKLISNPFLQILIVLGSFWGYLLVHNYLWWQGISSAGLVRVMAGVSPLVGIMAAVSLNYVSTKLNWGTKKIVSFIPVLLAVYMIGAAGEYYHRSVSNRPVMQTMEKASEFLNRKEFQRHTLIVHNPYFAYSTGRDAWNKDEIQYGFVDNNSTSQNLPDSTLFLWDAHFSPNEGGLPLEFVMKNPDFILIEYFEPEIPARVLGGHLYEIYIFRKLSGAESDNESILKNIRQKGIEASTFYMEEFTFEASFNDEAAELRRIQKGANESGFAFNLEGIEFSPTFHIPVKKLPAGKDIRLRASAEILMTRTNDPGQLIMVFSIESIDQVHHYVATDFSKQKVESDVWSKTDFIFYVPEKLKKEAFMKIYIWNSGNNKILLDNFKVEFFVATN